MAKDPAGPPELSDDDIYEAMKEIEGYLTHTGWRGRLYHAACRACDQQYPEKSPVSGILVLKF